MQPYSIFSLARNALSNHKNWTRAWRSPPLRERYDATPPPVPEVADRLLDLFDDRELKAVVRRALDHNPDLKVSLARLEEAGFNTKRARAPLFPSLDGTFSAARTDTPFRTDEGSLDAGLDARWEVDVWGGIRAGVAARTADEAAAARPN